TGRPGGGAPRLHSPRWRRSPRWRGGAEPSYRTASRAYACVEGLSQPPANRAGGQGIALNLRIRPRGALRAQGKRMARSLALVLLIGALVVAVVLLAPAQVGQLRASQTTVDSTKRPEHADSTLWIEMRDVD